ncbi:MAG TPA: hypothetical protein VFN67_32170 [Polyangiales bacterium]|nr:hypothetical protein [Polyangiales bacterium]
MLSSEARATLVVNELRDALSCAAVAPRKYLIMPDRSEILTRLTLIANRAEVIAISWHVALAVLGAAALLGWRPSRRMLTLGLSVPLGSVALCALYYGNPFNAGVFGVSALAAALLAIRAPTGPLSAASGWTRVLGGTLVAFGWIYPHFLQGSEFKYLYAAPLGVIPCPTLSAVIGITLLGNGLGAGTWSRLLAALGAFYAVFGALRLGVTIDLVLLLGALGLFVQTRQPRATALRV